MLTVEDKRNIFVDVGIFFGNPKFGYFVQPWNRLRPSKKSFEL